MKQRAFVRYTKSGKIIPGSMIMTDGSYPQGYGLYYEVQTNLCCETTTTTTAAPIVCNQYLNNAGETIFGLNYTLCNGTVVVGGGMEDGVTICIQEGSLSGAGSELLTNEGVCSV
jgi:hypothetical protein